MKVNFLILLLSWMLSTISAVPTNQTPLLVAPKAIRTSQFYYGATAAQHQANFLEWATAGYRMICLSVYGQPPNILYAAAYVLRSDPDEPPYVTISGGSSSEYQSFYDIQTKAGYVTTIISVTGPPTAPTFAAIMEQNGVTNWYQKCGLTISQYTTELSNAQANRYVLKSFAEYGLTLSDRQYCGVWYYDESNDQWDKYTTFVDQSYSAYEATLNAETTKPFWRPSYLSVSEDHLISSTFVDTDVGKWKAKHGMTRMELESESRIQEADNLHMIQFSAGGTGSNAHFAAVWATQDIPTPRTFRVTGSVTGFKDNDAASSQADALMEAFMKANGVRQAQFSVGYNGHILLQKAYSWSEATRHTSMVDDIFLLASLSKAFLEAAIQTLYDSPQLQVTPTTKVYPRLGYTNTPDSRLQEITVDQLLTHYGGLDETKSNFDPSYKMREIAIAQKTGATPATIKDVVDYMSRSTLDYNPGDPDGYAYSNYGYILLSYLVEHVTSMSYYDYLSSAVLRPGGYDVRQWPTNPSAHLNDPITQESKFTGLNAATPQNDTLIAHIFGGDNMYKDDCYGSAALAASATTLVNFIHAHAVWGIGPRAPGLSRSGSTAGSSAFAASLPNGIDWSVIVNTRDFPPSLPHQDPFENILCGTTIPGFLDVNPTA